MPAKTSRILGLLVILAFAGRAALADAGSHSTVRAIGIGRSPAHMQGAQARLMARRAAEVAAARNLAAKVTGVRSQGSGHGTASHEGQWALQGHRYSEPIYHADGTVEVTAELTLPRLRIGHTTSNATFDRAAADPATTGRSIVQTIVTVTTGNADTTIHCPRCCLRCGWTSPKGTVSHVTVDCAGYLASCTMAHAADREIAETFAEVEAEIQAEMRAMQARMEALLQETRAEMQTMEVEFR